MTMVYTLSGHYDTIPLTDTLIIADAAELSHETIDRHIRSHPEEFGLLGRVRLPSNELRNLAGESFHRLNEAQAATLFGYLRNTAANRELNMELQRQFGEVKFELYLRGQHRAKCNAARQEVINLVRKRGMTKEENVKCNNLAFHLAFGKDRNQYRRDNNIFGGKRSVDYMSIGDLDALKDAHNEIATMLQDGNDCEHIKASVMKHADIKAAPPKPPTAHKSTARRFMRKLIPFLPWTREPDSNEGRQTDGNFI